MSTLH
jgi:hypothetical protein